MNCHNISAHCQKCLILYLIYEMFSAEQIGCAVEVLWAYSIEQGKLFENAQSIITKDVLARKKNVRSK